MSQIMSILHVATAVFIVGPMAILPMTGLRALRSGEVGSVRALAKSTGLFSWLSLITFVLGFGLAGMWKISIATPWVLGSVIAYVIAFALSVFVVVPQLNKGAAQIEAAGAPGKPAAYGAVAATSGISTLLLVVVVVLMIWRP